MDYAFDTFVRKYLDERKQEFIEKLLGLVSVPSVKADAEPGQPFGPEAAHALDDMLALCSKAGLETKNLDHYCGCADLGSGGRLIGVLAHLDVVPLGQGWTRSPLGQLDGDRLYGRGASDNKGPALASLFALQAVMASGAKLKNRIRLIFGCDEESGMTDVSYYLNHEPAPDWAFAPDAGFPAVYAEKNIAGGTFFARLTEGTALRRLTGGVRVNVVPAQASAWLEGLCDEKVLSALGSLPGLTWAHEDGLLRIDARGVAAHAASPQEGANAIGLLVAALCRILPLSDTALPLMEAVRDRIGMEWDGAGLGIACNDDVTGPLTFNLGMADLSDGMLTFWYNIRHPVTLDVNAMARDLAQSLWEMGYTADETDISRGLYVPLDHPLMATLSQVYQDVTGDMAPPQTMGGGTYARKLPCAVAYGAEFPGQDSSGNIHTADEYVSIDSLLKAARIYAHALVRLGGMDA